jgi:two-component system, NarL family, nitrate/nitrite response regulator NarL
MTTDTKRPTVLITDDHALLRDTLAAFIRTGGQMEAETADGLQTCLEMIAARGGYDIVLLDFYMPGMNGLEGLEKVITANGAGPVAILSGNFPAELAGRALDMGVKGIIPKSLPVKSFTNAVRFIAAGEVYLPFDYQFAPRAANDRAGLTDAEARVLDRLCRGLANKEIGRDLSLSEATVKMHIRAICQKLGAKNRTQAALIAREMQLA